MTALVADKVAAWLQDHPRSTVTEIARAVRSQDSKVREVLSSPLFMFTTDGRRTLWSLSSSDPSKRGSVSHKERLLRLLSDGRPHSYREGYQLGVMMHSRVADLRRDGHNIVCTREGNDYIYQLRAAGEAERPGDTCAGDSASPAVPGWVDDSLTESPPHSGSPSAVPGAVDSTGQLVLSSPEFRRKVA